jgi:hypothetical protein
MRSPLTPAQVSQLLQAASPDADLFAILFAIHSWLPIFEAVYTGDIAGVRTIAQSDTPFASRPGLVVEIADDLPGGAKGPSSFHQASLVRALSGAHVVLVKSPEITREAMVVILITAIAGARAVMIETNATQEAAWLALIRSCGPATLVLPV